MCRTRKHSFCRAHYNGRNCFSVLAQAAVCGIPIPHYRPDLFFIRHGISLLCGALSFFEEAVSCSESALQSSCHYGSACGGVGASARGPKPDHPLQTADKPAELQAQPAGRHHSSGTPRRHCWTEGETGKGQRGLQALRLGSRNGVSNERGGAAPSCLPNKHVQICSWG